jgi:hypothetical protein
MTRRLSEQIRCRLVRPDSYWGSIFSDNFKEFYPTYLICYIRSSDRVFRRWSFIRLLNFAVPRIEVEEIGERLEDIINQCAVLFKFY